MYLTEPGTEMLRTPRYGLDQVFEQVTSDQASTSSLPATGHSGTVEKCQQASNIIVSALGDHALRVVCTVIVSPSVMIEKLSN